MSTRVATPLAGRAQEDACAAAFSRDGREQILIHLEDILRSPLFGNSKRYCALLRYVVEQTLDGRAEYLKERTIGVEAFGRPADYDTNADHSVRSAAGEVRRRLALYYAEFGAESIIRIELQPGSYVPQIRFLNVPVQAISSEADIPEVMPATWARWKTGWAAFPAALAVLLVCAISLRSAWQQRNPFDEFWGPILSSPNEALICVGGGRTASAAAGSTATLLEFEHSPARRMNVSDAMALVALTGTLESRNKPFRILNRASNTSFNDLRQGPFVLIGGMNNEWTLRLMSGLRFTFEHTATGARIADRQKPLNLSWSFNPQTPMDQPVRDYAIVTRLRDPLTQQSGIIVAGIGGWGTQAAAEFVSTPANIRKLVAHGPADWSQKNVQVVIATDLIHGSSGPPILLDAWFW